MHYEFLVLWQQTEDYSVWPAKLRLFSTRSVLQHMTIHHIFSLGIYSQALTSGIVASKEFLSKFCSCLWWGLRHLCTCGQELPPSTSAGEVILSVTFLIGGFILNSFLIGNIQIYLQSLGVRLEERRIRRHDVEMWLRYSYPEDFKNRIRMRYDQYNWMETRGVNEGNVVYRLPKDLRRHNKPHLICLALTRSVSLFENLDGILLDSLCKQLKPSLYTERSYIAREGDRVDEILFILRGRLESLITYGDRSRFYNQNLR